MQNWLQYITVPVIAALIGWITNYVAVKMLFHPRLPISIFGFSIQGVFPKRQQAFAQKLGELVSGQLLSTAEVTETLRNASKSPRIHEVIGTHLETAITKKLPAAIPMLSMVMNPQMVTLVKGTIMADVELLIDDLVTQLSGHIEEVLDIKKLVEEKVANFSSDKLEEIIQGIMKRELKFIELVGGVLGFAIGIVQVALMPYLA